MRLDNQIKVVHEKKNRENHKNEIINKIIQENVPELKYMGFYIGSYPSSVLHSWWKQILPRQHWRFYKLPELRKFPYKGSRF